MPVANPESFWQEARYQRVCAHCNGAGNFHAHHVVDKGTLKRTCGFEGDDLYDTRNALRLCEGLNTRRCHFNHEFGHVKVKMSELTDDNIEYAFEVLGAAAYDYLHRHYAGGDTRVERALTATAKVGTLR